jgi:hypothetical protein
MALGCVDLARQCYAPMRKCEASTEKQARMLSAADVIPLKVTENSDDAW